MVPIGARVRTCVQIKYNILSKTLPMVPYHWYTQVRTMVPWYHGTRVPVVPWYMCTYYHGSYHMVVVWNRNIANGRHTMYRPQVVYVRTYGRTDGRTHGPVVRVHVYVPRYVHVGTYRGTTTVAQTGLLRELLRLGFVHSFSRQVVITSCP